MEKRFFSEFEGLDERIRKQIETYTQDKFGMVLVHVTRQRGESGKMNDQYFAIYCFVDTVKGGELRREVEGLRINALNLFDAEAVLAFMLDSLEKLTGYVSVVYKPEFKLPAKTEWE